MTVFFTSDLHFGHSNIIQYCNRPYPDVESMNAALIRNWNEVVRPNDVVYILGDFSLSVKAMQAAAPLLQGQKILIPGNHDECCSTKHKSEQSRRKYRRIYSDHFLVMPEQNTYGDFLLSHLPYDCFDGRYADYHPIDHGGWLLHGHVHTQWKVRGRQINVGVDVNDYKPVAYDDILAIIHA